ncbi:MAG: hydroxyethylthiazole kinase [Fusobacteriaceae bacterium]
MVRLIKSKVAEEKEIVGNKIIENLNKLRKETPLIYHISNYVSINDCANTTIAIGGSPIMSMEVLEAEELVEKSSSLVINIGTLTENLYNVIKIACKKANELNIPIILDVVGLGASEYRNKTVKELVNSFIFTVVKGNLSEIKYFCGLEVKSKGVDTNEFINNETEMNEVINQMKTKAKFYNTILVATGEKDIICNSEKVYIVNNGNYLMSKISGSGCMLTSVISCFLKKKENLEFKNLDNFQNLENCFSALIIYNIAGEIAYENLLEKEGLATYKIKLMDSLYKITSTNILKNINYKVK